MAHERKPSVFKCVVREWCRAGKHTALALLASVWAIGHAIRVTVYFAALPFNAFVSKPESSVLAKFSLKAATIAIDLVYVVVPILVVLQWT